jgi:hypothetical protein
MAVNCGRLCMEIKVGEYYRWKRTKNIIRIVKVTPTGFSYTFIEDTPARTYNCADTDWVLSKVEPHPYMNSLLWRTLHE